MRRLPLALCIASVVSCSSAHPLLDTNVYKRRETALLLGEEPELARISLPFLLRAMSDVDAEVRWRAEFALGRAGPGIVPELAEALRGPDAWAAAYILGPFGKSAKSAAPALSAAATDPDANVRVWAVHSLGDIDPSNEAISRARRDDDPDVRRVAERALTPDDRPAAVLPGGAKFGLLIQWGLYSVPHRARPGESAERIMKNERLSATQYEIYGAHFTASTFDAREWVRIAKDAGARTLVLTAKHSDGFCLWDTKLTEFNSVRASEAKRDLVKELSRACKRAGMPFEVSYSISDWRHPDYEKNFPKYVDWMHRQIEELLDGYDISGLWLDGQREHSIHEWRLKDLVALIWRFDPAIGIGDTESCRTFGTSRGYTDSPEPLKSAERVIDELVDAVSKGEDFLLAVGARPDGTIPDALQERLTVIGEWLRWNGEAIHDTTRSPFGGPIPAGRVTAKGNRLYVFLGEIAKDVRIEFPGLKNRILKSWVLGTNDPLVVKSEGGAEWIPAPARLNEAVTVVGVELDGPPVVK